MDAEDSFQDDYNESSYYSSMCDVTAGNETASTVQSGVVQFYNMARKRRALTMPKTPMLMKHQSKFQRHKFLTSEELELEKIKRVKNDIVKKKLKAAKERKRSVDLQKPTKSSLSKVNGFNFETDGYIKEIDLEKEPETFDFVKNLRKNEDSKFVPSRTRPEPFVFHGKETKARDSVETLAEKCLKFTSKTPVRFRTRPVKDNQRPAHATLNATSTGNENQNNAHFKARPLNNKILSGPVGLKPRVQLPLTVPQSPSFAKRSLPKKPKDEVSINAGIPKICPLPPSTAPFKPQIEHRKVEPVPFSFESRDKEMLLKKEEKIKKVFEAEKEAREFHAQPLPIFDEVTLPAKKHRPVTVAEPFDFEIEKRVSVQHEKWQKKLAEERMREKENAEFKARPATVLEMEPFVPEKPSSKGHDISVQQKDVHLPVHTEQRAAAWKEVEKHQQEKLAELEEIALKRELRHLEEEEEEVRRIREQAVHKAQPVKNFKPVQVEHSSKPLTNPKTPRFSRRLTERYANKP